MTTNTCSVCGKEKCDGKAIGFTCEKEKHQSTFCHSSHAPAEGKHIHEWKIRECVCGAREANGIVFVAPTGKELEQAKETAKRLNLVPTHPVCEDCGNPKAHHENESEDGHVFRPTPNPHDDGDVERVMDWGFDQGVKDESCLVIRQGEKVEALLYGKEADVVYAAIEEAERRGERKVYRDFGKEEMIREIEARGERKGAGRVREAVEKTRDNGTYCTRGCVGMKFCDYHQAKLAGHLEALEAARESEKNL